MFERFTESAIRVIMLAQEESRRLSHNFVGTEQILLGLIAEGRGTAALVLRHAGVTLKHTRMEVEKIIGQGSDFVVVEIPFTPRAKRILELSWMEASRLGHAAINTEHLLLGLLKETEGVAPRVLENLNIDLANLRLQLIEAMGKQASDLFTPLPANPSFPIFPSNTTGIMLSSNIREEVFNWYSPDAIVVIQRAGGVAETAGSKEIGIEHLFLALLRDESLSDILLSAGLTLGQIRERIFKSLQIDDTTPSQSLPFSASAQKALEGAWLVGVEQAICWITKECIMLGLLRQDGSVVLEAIKDLGGDLPKIRQSLLESLRSTEKTIAEQTDMDKVKSAKPVGKPLGYTGPSYEPLSAVRKWLIVWLLALVLVVCLVATFSSVYLFGSSTFDYGTGTVNFISTCFWLGVIALVILGSTYGRKSELFLV